MMMMMISYMAAVTGSYPELCLLPHRNMLKCFSERKGCSRGLAELKQLASVRLDLAHFHTSMPTGSAAQLSFLC